MKRLVDVLLSSVGLLVLAPLLLVLSAVIWGSLGRPILFRQKRPGLHGKPFTILKFRTMTNERDSTGELLPEKERLTRVGRLLRTTSLDELPELWNVLKGEMSLVGPRPLLMEYLPLYTDEQSRRHEVRPGITGWAQVNGRNVLGWEDRFRLDLWYVENRTPWLDLKILFLTVGRVLLRRNIAPDGQVTVDRFKGTSANESTEIQRERS